jgi:probable HAF family extracellular repeat protein
LAAATPRYTVVDLGIASNPPDLFGPAINDRGQVAGWLGLMPGHRARAQQWTGERPTDLGTLPGYPLSYAIAINDAGQIAGCARGPEDRHSRAVLWQNGALTQLPIPVPKESVERSALSVKKQTDAPRREPEAAIPNAQNSMLNAQRSTLSSPLPYSNARGIGPQGWVVGAFQGADRTVHACCWQDGKPNDLGLFAGGNYSQALGVNRQGHVVGEANVVKNGLGHPFLWQEGQLRDLGLPPGGHFGIAHDINDHDQAVGWAGLQGAETHAFLWTEGQITDLGDLGSDPSAAWKINNRGQIVGNSCTSRQRKHAFLWENGQMKDLNDLIPADSGWQLRVATSINDAGRIVGLGIKAGELHMFLLIPNQADGNATAEQEAGHDSR